MPRYHSVNVLPKWAREKIKDLENQVETLRSYPVTLSFDEYCVIIVSAEDGARKSPVHLVAGDMISVSRPTIKLDSSYHIPEDEKLRINDILRNCMPCRARVDIEWGANYAGVH